VLQTKFVDKTETQVLFFQKIVSFMR